MRCDKCVQPCAKAINRVSNPKEVTHLNKDERVNIAVQLALMPSEFSAGGTDTTSLFCH